MNEWKYNAVAREFDDQLVEAMNENDRDSATKEAEDYTKRRGGGLQQIVDKPTPLEEVKALIEKKHLKTASQEVLEYNVRNELVKRASKGKRMVDAFLESSGANSRQKE